MDPHAWLADVLAKLPNTTASRLPTFCRRTGSQRRNAARHDHGLRRMLTVHFGSAGVEGASRPTVAMPAARREAVTIRSALMPEAGAGKAVTVVAPYWRKKAPERATVLRRSSAWSFATYLAFAASTSALSRSYSAFTSGWSSRSLAARAANSVSICACSSSDSLLISPPLSVHMP